jgi:hypothetical protein
MNKGSAVSKAYQLAHRHREKMAVVDCSFGDGAAFAVKALAVAQANYPADIVYIALGRA